MECLRRKRPAEVEGPGTRGETTSRRSPLRGTVVYILVLAVASIEGFQRGKGGEILRKLLNPHCATRGSSYITSVSRMYVCRQLSA